MIYVANFDLQAARIEKQPGLLPILDSPGPVGRLVFGQSDDPNEALIGLLACTGLRISEAIR